MVLVLDGGAIEGKGGTRSDLGAAAFDMRVYHYYFVPA